MVDRLHQVQDLAGDPTAIWDFFADPRNLDKITPPDLRFRIVSDPGPRMYQGQLIEYRVSFMPLVWSRWLTEIRHVRDGAYFVDEQRIGPYRLWYHEHSFAPIPGGMRMTDLVTYDVGRGPLGAALHALWIRRKLEWIFTCRRSVVAGIFPPPPG